MEMGYGPGEGPLTQYSIGSGATLIVSPRLVGGGYSETWDRFKEQGLERTLGQAVTAAIRADAANPVAFVAEQ